MAQITAQAVNEFRKRTGLGLMECKALLQEADGDLARAETLAKERGLKKAESRMGRAATAGRIEVLLAPDHKSGALVELNCETDFVARNDEFRKVSKELAELVLAHGDQDVKSLKLPSGNTVADTLVELNSRTGENVGLARAVKLHISDAGRVDAYVHHDAKSGAIVALKAPSPEAAGSEAFVQLAKDLALHAVASRPAYLTRADVPAAEVAEQKRIYVLQVPEDKPEQIREKIAEGKLNAWFAETVFLEQPFVKEPAKKVSDIISSTAKGAELVAFARFIVGEAAQSAS